MCCHSSSFPASFLQPFPLTHTLRTPSLVPLIQTILERPLPADHSLLHLLSLLYYSPSHALVPWPLWTGSPLKAECVTNYWSKRENGNGEGLRGKKMRQTWVHIQWVSLCVFGPITASLEVQFSFYKLGIMSPASLTALHGRSG